MLPNLTAFGPLCEHCSDRLSGMSYWTDRRPVHRSRAVDVPTLARAAVRLLDEGGMSALTMRAVASEIGVAAASLYSRVRSVEDILDLALDTALGDDPGLQRALSTSSGADGSGLEELLIHYFHHLRGTPRVAQVITDRKSTRLNSSHVAISYA